MSRLLDPADAVLLAEALVSRLCHDLSGQVNAVTAAMEVLREEAEPDRDMLDLAGDAGMLLARRLRFARVAWGSSAGPVPVAEWRRIAGGIARRGVELDLDGVADDGSFAPAAARLSLNLLLLAAEALPHGGTVVAEGDARADLVVRPIGPRAAWSAGLATLLADPDEAVARLRGLRPDAAARSVQATFTAMISHATGQRVSLLLGAQAEEAPPLLVTLAQG